MLFFSTLAIYCAVKALTAVHEMNSASPKEMVSIWGWLIGMAAVTGLAGASKLNGLMIATAVILVVIAVSFKFPRSVTQESRISFMLKAIVLLLLTIGLTFILINPYLYPNPIYRTALMIKFRNYEMTMQQVLYPESIIANASRLSILFSRLFQDFTFLNFHSGWLVNCFLFGIGLYVLIRSAHRWLKGRSGDATAGGILFVSLTMVVPSLFTPLDWERYYLFPVLFICLCTSVGFGSFVKILVSHGKHFREMLRKAGIKVGRKSQ